MRPLGPSPISRASSSATRSDGVALAQGERGPEPGVAAADDRHVDLERPASGGATGSGRNARASSSHHDGRDGSGGFRLRGRIDATLSRAVPFRPSGNRDRMRTMFAIYWFMILGGLALWIGVGLVVD